MREVVGFRKSGHIYTHICIDVLIINHTHLKASPLNELESTSCTMIPKLSRVKVTSLCVVLSGMGTASANLSRLSRILYVREYHCFNCRTLLHRQCECTGNAKYKTVTTLGSCTIIIICGCILLHLCMATVKPTVKATMNVLIK